jgi:predicted transcriptional regulator
MTSSFRMNEELEQLLDRAAQASGKTRSDIVREAVEGYCLQVISSRHKSWQDILVASGFKPIKSGVKNLARDKNKLRKVIREKAGRRSR